jgi:ribose 5-phosphate isomerase B
MRIAIGSDHRGVELKERIRSYLLEGGHEVQDLGARTKDSCDYPDFAFSVASGVSRGEYDRGILICSTGNGMVIAANKVGGIRAALALNTAMAQLSRAHNDSNILVLSADFTEGEMVEDIVQTWLDTLFEGGRHARRLEKIKQYEETH